jgi:hypothetical protein
MLKLFKDEPIVIKGCLGFGLKEVTRGMNVLGLIDIQWDENSTCCDGAAAMLGAYEAHRKASSRGISMKEMSHIREIVKYNEIDCQVLQKILEYLRTHHTIPPENFGLQD